MPKVHIIGAGLAGLSAAVRLAGQGYDVAVYEGAGQAGGRCRSFHDKELDHLIDNGNHLLLSGNHAAHEFLTEIGSQDSLEGPPHAKFPFVDLKTGDRWVVDLNDGKIPFWVFDRNKRIPGTKLSDYLPALKVAFAGPGKTVDDLVPTGNVLYERFWDPMTVAVLNMTTDKGAANLLGRVLRETFFAGGEQCRPLIAKQGLGPSFIAPALAFLENKGMPVQFNRRAKALTIENGRVANIGFTQGEERVLIGEQVIVAVPPERAAKLIPELTVPRDGEVIVNAHFRLAEPVAPWSGENLLGLVNATAHWAFVRSNIISLTISAAGEVAEKSHDELIPHLWAEITQAFDLDGTPYQAARIIKEKRATFDQSPDSVAKRPKTKTDLANLYLAGDWTDTGLPATIEGAIRSGHAAARAVKNG